MLYCLETSSTDTSTDKHIVAGLKYVVLCQITHQKYSNYSKNLAFFSQSIVDCLKFGL